ncbi:MAG: response regulator [Chloroflexi bacterium]|nr:response regulator [Chloroflexota bacterium]
MNLNLPASKAKILVAEDTADLREVLVEVLLDLGYNVQAASDGYEATTMFEQFKPDLAILDMRMPMMNGADVCAIIRKTSDIPIIMFTSADEVSEVNGAILKGATDFVLKTTGMDQLASRVEAHLLRQREPLKPLLTAADSLVLEGKITDKPPENIHLSNGPPNAIKTFTVIIDPDKESRAKITSVLIRLNQNFIEVESAGEGIAAIQDYKPQLVVTEWTLPDMDTFKMFSSLGEGFQAKSLTRIIMSDRLSPEIHRKSNFVGINNFLEKPVDPGKAEVMIGSCIRTAFRKLKNTAAMAA